MVDRGVSWGLILMALVVTVAIMAGIIYTGQILTSSQAEDIKSEISHIVLSQESQDITRRLADELGGDRCRFLKVEVRNTVQDLNRVQDKVTAYEEAKKLSDPEFKVLKKRYTNLLLDYWLTTRKIEDNCGSNSTKALYIYAEQGRCPRCADQGTIISSYREGSERLLVFPLDADLNMRSVETIIDFYNVKKFPAIIISGKVYEGFKNRKELGKILDKHMNRTGNFIKDDVNSK